MYTGSFLAVKEEIGIDSLAVAVRPEIDGTCRYDTDEIWAKPFEQSSPAFDFRYLAEYLTRLCDVNP